MQHFPFNLSPSVGPFLKLSFVFRSMLILLAVLGILQAQINTGKISVR